MRITNRRTAPISIFEFDLAIEGRNGFGGSAGRLRASEALDTTGPEREDGERQYLSVATLIPLLDRANSFTAGTGGEFHLRGNYFPMQKVLKIRFKMSSVVVSPVIESSGRREL